MKGWQGIEEFVAVCDSGSFSAAARRLNVSTAHISRMVVALEKRLGQPLLLRTNRQVTLTHTGKSLAEGCRRIIMARDAVFDLNADAGVLQGHIRMACPSSLAEQYMAPLVNRFLAANPRVSAEIDLTNRPVELIAEGYDMAIRFGALQDSRLVASRLSYISTYVAASPAYLERQGTPQTPDDLQAHTCLLGMAPEWAFRDNGVQRTIEPQGRFKCNSARAMIDAALDGYGLVYLPGFQLQAHIASGALVSVLDAYRPDEEPVWVLYPNHRHITAPVRGLVDDMRRQFRMGLEA